MISITDDNYSKEVSNGLVLIDFYGSWCVPCVQVEEILSNLEPQYTGIKFVKANIEENIQLRKQYKIMGLPTLLLLQDGNKVELIGGLRSELELKNILNKYK